MGKLIVVVVSYDLRANKGLEFIPKELFLLDIGKHLLKAKGVEDSSHLTFHVRIVCDSW